MGSCDRGMVGIKIFFLGTVALFWGDAIGKEISFGEVQKVTEEILTHHFCYKKLTGDLLAKSCKKFLRQFDQDGSYLLEEEVAPYFQLSKEKKEQALVAYAQGRFPIHLSLQTLFTKAVQRARRLRAHLRMELLETPLKNSRIPPNWRDSFPKNEHEQIDRVKNIMQCWLDTYAKKHGKGTLDREDRFLVLQFHEKKRREHEEKFVSMPPKKRGSLVPIEILKAIGASLDEYTKVYGAEEAEILRTHLQKKFCGIGVTLAESVEGVFITKVLPQSPAEYADIRVNDRLISIDGKEVSTLSFQKVAQKLDGKKGEKVDLVLERPLKGRVDTTLQREEIVQEEEKVLLTSESFANGLFGVFSIPSFYEGASQDLKGLFKELKKQGPILGVILDVRYNRGGFLEEALRARDIFSTGYYQGPLIVLISKQTAASAEFFVEALREEGLCIVVGDERTSGLGVIQHQTLTEGNSLAYQVSIGHLFSPKGRGICPQGICSDIVIPTKISRQKKGDNDPVLKRIKTVCSGFFPPIHRYTPFTTLIPKLLENSRIRIQEDRNFQAFLGNKPREKSSQQEGVSFAYGKEDLPLKEARNVLKDAAFLIKTPKKRGS